MVTNYPQQLTAAGESTQEQSASLVARAMKRLSQMFCALRGHDLMLHIEGGRRICLRCVTCGHETPGWHID